MSRIYGPFNPRSLKYMPKLKMIDISNTRIEAKPFVDAVIDKIGIEEIYLRNCTQFSERQIIEMMCCLPNLTIIDATGTKGILYVSAYIICCSLTHLRVFKLEPKYPFFERFDWSKLKCMFPHIDFGKKIDEVAYCARKK